MTTKTKTALRLLAATLAASACDCGTTPDPVGKLTFVSPRDGQAFNVADDGDPRTDGVQVQAEVLAENLEGAVVTIEATEGTFTKESATVAGGRASMPITITGGLRLVAKATTKGGTKVESAPASITLDAATRACRIVTPADGAVLGLDADENEADGYQVTVRVRCVGTELGNPVELSLGGAKVGQAPLGSGNLASFTGVELAEGENTISVATKNNAGQPTTASAKVTVKTGACDVRLSPPTGTVFNARGEGGATADLVPGSPMNAKITVDAKCAGADISIKRGSVEIARGTAGSTPTAIDVALDDGFAELRAVLSGSAKGASPLVRYTVDGVVPTAKLLFPAGGETFGDAQDQSADPGLQITARGEFSGIGGGKAYELVLDAGTSGEVVIPGVLSSDEKFSASLSLPNGAHTLIARAKRTSGTTAKSDSVSFSANFLGASLALASPRDGDAIPLAGDADTDAPGLQVRFNLVATNLSGKTGSLTCGTAPAPFTIGSDGKGSAIVSFTDLPCAGQRVTCNATLEADGATFETPAVKLLVDATPPTVTLVTPHNGDFLATSSISVEATTDCPGERQNALLARGADVIAGPDTFEDNTTALAGVTLIAGENGLVLHVADEAGNDTETPFTVFVDADVPQPAFINPDPSGDTQWTASDDSQNGLVDGFQHPVSIEVPNENVGTLVELSVGSRAPISARTTEVNGKKVVVFENVSFAEGETTLRACATDDAGSLGCVTQRVTLTTGRPTCVVSKPSDGAVVGQRDDLDTAAAGVQANVDVDTSAEAGTLVSLKVTGPNGVQTITTPVASSKASFSKVSFATEGSWRLEATCTNQVGASATSLPNDVTVRFSAPSFDVTEPTADQVFNSASPDRGSAAGFQIDVKIQTSAPAAGAMVSLSVNCGSGPVVVPSVAVNTQQTATFRAVTLPDDAACDLTLNLEDTAGNTAGPVTRRITVDRVAPSITIIRPADGALYGKARDANQATAAFDLDRVEASVAGAAAGDAPITLRVGGQPVTGGTFADVAGGRRQGTWLGVILAEGTNVISASATDAAGNLATQQVTLHVDTLGPVVNIQSLANDAILRLSTDVDPATPGVQVNISLTGEKLVSGTTVRICSINAPSTATACETGTGRRLAEASLSGGAAVVPRVTLPEGTIEIYAEAVDIAGNKASSSTLRITVDGIPPLVESIQLVKYSGTTETVLDTSSGTAAFGAADDSDTSLPGFQVRLKAKITGIEAGKNLRAQFVSTNPAPGTVLGAPLVAADGTIVLDKTLGEGGHRIHIFSTDAAGNFNATPDSPVTGQVVKTINFAVKLTPPAITLVAPTPGALLASADKDAATAGLQVDVIVESDAGAGRTVQLKLDGADFDTATLPATGTRVTKRVTIPEGAHTLAAAVSDVVGNAATTPTIPVTVDSIAPVIAITLPQPGTVSTDADAVEPGFQLAIQLTYSNVENGREIIVLSSTGGELARVQTASAGVAVLPPVTLPGGAQQLTARVSDASGNVTTSTPVAITVDLNAPTVRFQASGNPLRFGLATGVSADNTKCEFSLVALCDADGATVQLLVGGSPAQTKTSASGQASFTAVQIAPGTPVTLQLKATDTQNRIGFSASRQATCDLTKPTVAFTDPVGGATIKYVAFGNPGGVANARADKVAGAPLEADLTLRVTGGIGGKVALSSSLDGALGEQTITTDPQTVTFSSLAITSSGTHVVTATATDESGNTETTTFTAQVDVVAPGAANIVATVEDGRKGRIKFAFTAPGSDGTAGGKVAGYVVRRADTNINSESTWSLATVVTPIDPTLVDPGQAQTVTVDGIPYERQYFFAVRAVDGMGNLGAIGTAAAIDLRLTRRYASVVKGASGLWVRLVTGDLDGDGFDDFVATAADEATAANGGKISVVYGAANLATAITITGSGAGRFGGGAAVGDVNGDGRLDLAISSSYATAADSAAGTRDGSVSLFLGRANTRLTATSVPDSVIFGKVPAADGTAQTSALGVGLALVDVDGDGKKDVVASAPYENVTAGGRQGRVYIVKGRATWPATLSVATDRLAVVTSNFVRTGTTTGAQLGRTVVNLGDVNADGKEDFAINAPGGTATAETSPRPVYLVSGALARGDVVADTISAAVYPTIPPLAYTVGTSTSTYGIEIAGAELTGDSIPDLALIDGTDGKVFIYSGAVFGPLVPTAAVSSAVVANASLLGSGLVTTSATTVTNRLYGLPGVRGTGLDGIAVVRESPTGPGNEFTIIHGRTAAQWTALAGALPSDTVVKAVDTSKEGANWGVRVATGKILGNDSRDLVVLDLASGNAAILSGP